MQSQQVKSSYFFLILFILLVLATPLQNEEEHNEAKEKIEKYKEKVDRGPSAKYADTCSDSSNLDCSKLRDPCIKCTFNETCIYGSDLNVSCEALTRCNGPTKFERSMNCRYCYQTPHWQHKCVLKGGCDSVRSPLLYYRTNCTVNSDVLCLGKRTFLKNIRCNWTGGYRWSKAFLLSITLGGFGADRFYLGHWQDGVGKLFSFGGLGVWTLIDVILISIHYLGPADGSLYV
nr:PREDICTED: TM2 domain-containing protein almondex [Bemisia tabaci]